MESKSTDTLRGLESFVKAVESGSIAAGARLLGISAAAASQNIARLEQSLGVRLLTRTTRRLALTDAGASYFERVQGVLAAQATREARRAAADAVILNEDLSVQRLRQEVLSLAARWGCETMVAP